MNYLYASIREDLKRTAIENRETCHHWINYEIYDSLNDDLKEKYIRQFNELNITFKPAEVEKMVKFQIFCDSNHHDPYSHNKTECTHKYPKTVKEFRKKFSKMGAKNV